MVRMRGPNRRQMYAEQTRADLVAAARKLFVDNGFAKTSVEAITGAALVSKGTFTTTSRTRKRCSPSSTRS